MNHWKETISQTIRQLEEHLKASVTKYANHAENIISKLQKTYSNKYYPGRYTPSHSVVISQRSQDVPNKRVGGKVRVGSRQEDTVQELEPVKHDKSDEGITNIIYILQLLK